MSLDCESAEQGNLASDFEIMRDEIKRLMQQRVALLDALIDAEKALNEIRICCHHTAWDQTGPAVMKARSAIALAKSV